MLIWMLALSVGALIGLTLLLRNAHSVTVSLGDSRSKIVLGVARNLRDFFLALLSSTIVLLAIQTHVVDTGTQSTFGDVVRAAKKIDDARQFLSPFLKPGAIPSLTIVIVLLLLSYVSSRAGKIHELYTSYGRKARILYYLLTFLCWFTFLANDTSGNLELKEASLKSKIDEIRSGLNAAYIGAREIVVREAAKTLSKRPQLQSALSDIDTLFTIQNFIRVTFQSESTATDIKIDRLIRTYEGNLGNSASPIELEMSSPHDPSKARLSESFLWNANQHIAYEEKIGDSQIVYPAFEDREINSLLATPHTLEQWYPVPTSTVSIEDVSRSREVMEAVVDLVDEKFAEPILENAGTKLGVSLIGHIDESSIFGEVYSIVVTDALKAIITLHVKKLFDLVTGIAFPTRGEIRHVIASLRSSLYRMKFDNKRLSGFHDRVSSWLTNLTNARNSLQPLIIEEQGKYATEVQRRYMENTQNSDNGGHIEIGQGNREGTTVPTYRYITPYTPPPIFTPMPPIWIPTITSHWGPTYMH